MTIKLGDFAVPAFDALAAVFGADVGQYPPMSSIPEGHRSGHSPQCRAASALFFSGGRLADHGFSLLPTVDEREFYTALRSYMSSFDPKHEHKIATCGWLIAECAKAPEARK